MKKPFKRERVQVFFTEPSLTETEHTDSCDVNKMIKNAFRGIQVRGSSTQPRYGIDDLTVDPVSYRVQKRELEDELTETAQTHEFSEEEIKIIPKSILEKFGFKSKQTSKTQPVTKVDEPSNDDSNNEPAKSDPS